VGTNFSRNQDAGPQIHHWAEYENKGWPIQVVPGGYSKDGKIIRAELNKVFPKKNYAIRWRQDQLELIAPKRLTKKQEENLRKHYKDSVKAQPNESKK